MAEFQGLPRLASIGATTVVVDDERDAVQDVRLGLGVGLVPPRPDDANVSPLVLTASGSLEAGIALVDPALPHGSEMTPLMLTASGSIDAALRSCLSKSAESVTPGLPANERARPDGLTNLELQHLFGEADGRLECAGIAQAPDDMARGHGALDVTQMGSVDLSRVTGATQHDDALRPGDLVRRLSALEGSLAELRHLVQDYFLRHEAAGPIQAAKEAAPDPPPAAIAVAPDTPAASSAAVTAVSEVAEALATEDVPVGSAAAGPAAKEASATVPIEQIRFLCFQVCDEFTSKFREEELLPISKAGGFSELQGRVQKLEAAHDALRQDVSSVKEKAQKLESECIEMREDRRTFEGQIFKGGELASLQERTKAIELDCIGFRKEYNAFSDEITKAVGGVRALLSQATDGQSARTAYFEDIKKVKTDLILLNESLRTTVASFEHRSKCIEERQKVALSDATRAMVTRQQLDDLESAYNAKLRVVVDDCIVRRTQDHSTWLTAFGDTDRRVESKLRSMEETLGAAAKRAAVFDGQMAALAQRLRLVEAAPALARACDSMRKPESVCANVSSRPSLALNATNAAALNAITSEVERLVSTAAAPPGR